MTQQGFALFDAPIGRCAIVWSARGVAGLLLPEAREAELRGRLARRFPTASEAAPPPKIQAAIAAIAALFAAKPSDLSAIALDMAGVPPFHRRVYEALRAIPPGETLSYGALASRAGAPGAARAVGQALKRNPFAMIVPCHRVLAADGGLHGFSAPGGLETKRRMLEIEGAPGFAQQRLFGR